MKPTDSHDREPMSAERLAEIRTQYATETSTDAAVIIELLNEIDQLDDLLGDSEDEVERLQRLLSPSAVSGSVSRTLSGKWRARWREADGTQRSRTFGRRRDAEYWLKDAQARQRQAGGAE
ncbi:hypothetical protein AB0O91_21205 [Kitasatospora sp. NPDC089797]|uniref:hypothetical protein n=1 Tax=Kitasatospora sp. NPDC089797 TaxID=3155298 RepID=UPI0034269FFB